MKTYVKPDYELIELDIELPVLAKASKQDPQMMDDILPDDYDFE